jgi:transposase-like protein
MNFDRTKMIEAFRKVFLRMHYPLEVMLLCVRWYAAYPMSFRNIEQMMTERGVFVDHSTLHRCRSRCCRYWRWCFAGASCR